MKQEIEAVIFDADGTILDTREFLHQSFEHALAAHGHTVPTRERIASVSGRLLKECYEILAPDGKHDMLCEEHAAFGKRNMHLVEGYEGLHETLEALRNAGIRMGICTSRGATVFDMLHQVGASDYFETIVHVDMIQKHKPDPESVLKVLEILDITAERTAMVGDTIFDVQAARAAALAMSIAITHGMGTRQELENERPDHIVDHLSEVPALIL